MSVVSFRERIDRLAAITAASPVIGDFELVKILSITDAHKAHIRAALNAFLWSSLAATFPERPYTLNDDMLAAYEADIIRLPNITPNGLILPKRENIGAFNVLQKEVVTAFTALGIGESLARVQIPVHVRLQSGTPDPIIDSRPRASVKPHSDIWAGDPAGGLLVFLCVLGDPQKSGIEFFMPDSFPLSIAHALEDYNDGQAVFAKAQKVTSFDTQGWFLVDPYVIHRTTKNAPGYRLSLDFRVVPAQTVASDTDAQEIRKHYFIPFSQWKELGTETLFATDDGIREFSKANKTDSYAVGFPTKLSVLDVKQATDLRQWQLGSQP